MPQELYCPIEGRTDPVADEWERRALCMRPGSIRATTRSLFGGFAPANEFDLDFQRQNLVASSRLFALIVLMLQVCSRFAMFHTATSMSPVMVRHAFLPHWKPGEYMHAFTGLVLALAILCLFINACYHRSDFLPINFIRQCCSSPNSVWASTPTPELSPSWIARRMTC